MLSVSVGVDIPHLHEFNLGRTVGVEIIVNYLVDVVQCVLNLHKLTEVYLLVVFRCQVEICREFFVLHVVPLVDVVFPELVVYVLDFTVWFFEIIFLRTLEVYAPVTTL